MSGGSLGRKITGTTPNTRHPLIDRALVSRVGALATRRSPGSARSLVHRHSTAWPAQIGGSASVLPGLSPSLSVVLSIDVAEADLGRFSVSDLLEVTVGSRAGCRSVTADAQVPADDLVVPARRGRRGPTARSRGPPLADWRV